MMMLQCNSHEAAAAGHVNVLRLFYKVVDSDISLDKVVINCYESTPLHVASQMGQIDSVGITIISCAVFRTIHCLTTANHPFP
jgi:hypothetical protein